MSFHLEDQNVIVSPHDTYPNKGVVEKVDGHGITIRITGSHRYRDESVGDRIWYSHNHGLVLKLLGKVDE